MDLEAIAERKRLRKERRAEMKLFKLAQTNNNPDYARKGSRDESHAKHVPVNGNSSGSRPIEAFYDLGTQSALVVYKSPNDVPHSVLGVAPSIKLVDILSVVFVSSPGNPVRRLAYRLNLAERDFWVGSYAGLLEQVGSRFSVQRTEAWKKLQVEKERIRDAPLPEPTYRRSGNWSGHSAINARVSPLERRVEGKGIDVKASQSNGSIAYVFYHEYNQDYDPPTGERDVLVLADHVPELTPGRFSRVGKIRGYTAVHLKVPTMLEPAQLAESLATDVSKVRVGHYSDFCEGNYIQEAFNGETGVMGLLKVAGLPKEIRNHKALEGRVETSTAEAKPTEGNDSIAYVFVNERTGIDGRSVAVFAEFGKLPHTVEGVSPRWTSFQLGYDTAFFKIPSGIQVADISAHLSVPQDRVRVGCYQDFAGEFIPNGLLGHGFELRAMLRIAGLPENHRNPNAPIKPERPGSLPSFGV